MLSTSLRQFTRVSSLRGLGAHIYRSGRLGQKSDGHQQDLGLCTVTQGNTQGNTQGTFSSRSKAGLCTNQPALGGAFLSKKRGLHNGSSREKAKARKLVPEPEIYCSDTNGGEVLVSSDRKLVILGQVKGHSGSFNATWLRHNCHCPECKQSHSGQRLFEPAELQPTYNVLTAKIQDDSLLVQWEGESDHSGQIPLSFLQENDYSTERREEEAQSLHYPRICQNGQVPTVSYEEVKSSDIGLLRWLQYLNEEGICLVREVPCKSGTVREVTEFICPVQPTIYGEVFDVVSDPKPINVAYSNVRLGFHMDLIYYESAPGLQILHCLQFDKQVEGGESILVDAWHTAEVLRQNFPREFATLCHVPATFQKIHFERERPVHIKYRKPHIECSPNGHIVAVNWAPAFEGPLHVDEKYIENYYNAYHRYAQLLEESPTRVEFRLDEGDMLSFNNRRILHARKGFVLNGGKRHLQGCYVNIDEFKSRLTVLSKRLESETPVKHVFNHDWL